MAIGTKVVATGGNGLAKTINPGNHRLKIKLIKTLQIKITLNKLEQL